MALHLTRSNALLLLTPKTGSTWIRKKIRELGIPVEEIGDPAMREHDLLADFDRSQYGFVGAFVRDPLEWYRSYWSYRMEKGWRPQYALDEHCESDVFETFVRRAVTTLPGALGNIYSSYVGAPGEEVDFIGRQEDLQSDFARFLTLAGEDFDAEVLAQGSRVNATTIRPDYPEELKELITLSEWETMGRFGYLADRPDPIALAEMQDRYPEDANDLRLLSLWTEKIHWAPDDKKREAGRPVPASTRHARVNSNFALYAEHKKQDPQYAGGRYREALRLDPAHPRTLCNYALYVAKHEGDVAQARTLMLRALGGRPNHPYTLGKLAWLTAGPLDDPALAEVLYRQSLIANAAQHELRVEFANFLDRHGRPEEALALLAPAAESQDAERLTLLTHASLLARAGRLAEARVFQGRAAARLAAAQKAA
ncbi:tetratricopeptide repeat protein [Streptomyces sp. NPDC053429]|uniref:tetratricopeptide repeat protein n=1 Tax=Streptomyces sp. NPDC053429 TaxID=3365702 RepID=UPI0037D15026